MRLISLIVVFATACGGRTPPPNVRQVYPSPWATAERPCVPTAVTELCVTLTAADGDAIRAALLATLAEDIPNLDEAHARTLIGIPSDRWTIGNIRIEAIAEPGQPGEVIELTAFTPDPVMLRGFRAMLARIDGGWRVMLIEPYHAGVPQPT